MRKNATSTALRVNAKPAPHRLHLVVAAEPAALEADLDDKLASLDPPELDDDEHIEQTAESSILTEDALSTEDLVGVYLREMGVTPMLTREGEAALAVRIERGLRRAAKATSRLPICIEEMISIGEQLKRGELHIREVVNFRDQEEITEGGIQDALATTIESIGEIAGEYKRTLKFLARVQSEPKRSKKLPRLRRKLVRHRVHLSRLIRGLDLTGRQREHLAGLIRAAVKQAREAKHAVAQATSVIERKRTRKTNDGELKNNLRRANRSLAVLEQTWR
ncbi:MAG TPA: sigma-70 factor domain-containing protein, partial [Blastocatellia bacterium]|nr:sigma-70 factor domain-containing protein [Blastocatellia bacterium]